MKTGKRVAGKTETEVYQKLGLAFIPPELREDRGEIEAAREGRLPHLIEVGDLVGTSRCTARGAMARTTWPHGGRRRRGGTSTSRSPTTPSRRE